MDNETTQKYSRSVNTMMTLYNESCVRERERDKFYLSRHITMVQRVPADLPLVALHLH